MISKWVGIRGGSQVRCRRLHFIGGQLDWHEFQELWERGSRCKMAHSSQSCFRILEHFVLSFGFGLPK